VITLFCFYGIDLHSFLCGSKQISYWIDSQFYVGTVGEIVEL